MNKGQLPEYQFKIGEECFVPGYGFTNIAETDQVFATQAVTTEAGVTYYYPDRPLTIAEAKLLGVEVPKKMKKVTLFQAVFKTATGYQLSGFLYESEPEAKECVDEFIKLVNPVELEVEE